MALALSGASEMPMGQSAQLPLDTSELMGHIPTQSQAQTPPPPTAAGMMGDQGGAMGFPAPGAPAEPQFDVKLQPDGSSIYVTKTNPQIVIGVNRPPKLPKALQP